MHRSPRFPAAAGLAAGLLLGSCASAPPPRPLPALPLQLQVGAFAGAALAGPQPDAPPPPPAARVCRLRYSLQALAAMPLGAESLARRAELLARPDSEAPLRATSAVAAQIAVLSATAAQQLCEQLATAPTSAVLPLTDGIATAAAGYTTTLRVLDSDAPLASNSLLVAVDADLTLHLLFAADRDRRLELLPLPAATAADAPFVFAWPRPLSPGIDGAVALLLQVEPADADAEAIAGLQRQAAAARRSAAASNEPPTQQYLRQQRRLQALQALSQPEVRRRALLQLAQESSAALLADLALSGGDELLAATIAALGDADELAALPAAPLALALDRAGYRALLPLLDQQDVDPALLAVLYAHAGAVGSDRNALQSIVERAADPTQLQHLLAQENLAFLYEDDPARMVAAFDWLQAQGLAPAGFDPLADRSARRAALRAHERATTTEHGR